MKLIPLTRGLFAQVDDHWFEEFNRYKWCAHTYNHTSYALRNSKTLEGKAIQIHMHRVIMNTPEGMDVDHIDHNGLNCLEENMRNCTRSQNLRNKKAKGAIPYLGVSYLKVGKYTYIQAQLSVNNYPLHLGTFNTVEEAAHAYDEKAKELFGEFANLNFK